MALLVSAKGNDVLAWRAAGDFSATFRQQLLARLEFCKADEGERLLTDVEQALAALMAENAEVIERCEGVLAEVSSCTEQSRYKEYAEAYYSVLYGHVATHHSAVAFYGLSTRFLHALAGAIMRQALAACGTESEPLPELKLIALGPAGRQEFSPFCPLHLLLVHRDGRSIAPGTYARMGQMLSDGFTSAGFHVDSVVTPVNPAWRGSYTEWRQRLTAQLDSGESEDLIDFFRLSDQTVLYQTYTEDENFFQLCTSLLKHHRAALDFQVSRVLGLSHGIGIMGGMRFEKKGPYRGKFALLDNGLQPLAAAVATMAIFKSLDSSSTPQRIREILWMRKLNVDMAERLLQAWHTLHELRLLREGETHPQWGDQGALHLEIDDLDDGEQAALRESLESVGAIQRHVGLTYSSMEG